MGTDKYNCTPAQAVHSIVIAVRQRVACQVLGICPVVRKKCPITGWDELVTAAGAALRCAPRLVFTGVHSVFIAV
jgi:hypothetical protein